MEDLGYEHSLLDPLQSTSLSGTAPVYPVLLSACRREPAQKLPGVSIRDSVCDSLRRTARTAMRDSHCYRKFAHTMCLFHI